MQKFVKEKKINVLVFMETQMSQVQPPLIIPLLDVLRENVCFMAPIILYLWQSSGQNLFRSSDWFMYMQDT